MAENKQQQIVSQLGAEVILPPETLAMQERVRQAYTVLMGDPTYRIHILALSILYDWSDYQLNDAKSNGGDMILYGDGLRGMPAYAPDVMATNGAEIKNYSLGGDDMPRYQLVNRHLNGHETTMLDIFFDRIRRVIPEGKEAQAAFADMIMDMPVLNPSRVIEGIWALALASWQYTDELRNKLFNVDSPLITENQLVLMREVYPQELKLWTFDEIRDDWLWTVHEIEAQRQKLAPGQNVEPLVMDGREIDRTTADCARRELRETEEIRKLFNDYLNRPERVQDEAMDDYTEDQVRPHILGKVREKYAKHKISQQRPSGRFSRVVRDFLYIPPSPWEEVFYLFEEAGLAGSSN